jgi:phospholipid/cholesterol/gamma-HCH transport system substrate-binding protein
MTRRTWINLIVFAVLGVVMTFWALANVITFDVFTKPRHIRVEFSSSPGLQPNFDVTYLGVTVGKIKSVRLGHHMVVADLDLNRGATVPDNVTAAAGRKSVIGEPYVDLALPPASAPGPPLRGGETIPASRTTVAVSYDALFAAADKAVQGLNADDLHTLTHELALGWNGRSGSVSELLDSSEQITSTFAHNTALLNSLIGELTTVSGTLAAHRDELGSSLDNLTSFTDALASETGPLTTVIRQSPDLVQRFNQILDATLPEQKCILRSLDQALPVILSKPAMDSLAYQSQTAPQLVSVLNEISPKGPTGLPNLNIDFVITLNGPKPAPEYTSPQPLPTVGRIPSCPGVVIPPSAQPAGATKGQASPATSTPLPSPSTISGRQAAQQERSTDPGFLRLTLIPPLVALVILLGVGFRAMPLLLRSRALGAWDGVRVRRKGGSKPAPNREKQGE